MGQPKPATPVKRFIVALSPHRHILDELGARLSQKFGLIEAETVPRPWNYSPAYVEEMGPGILRKFFSLTELGDPEDLPDWKAAAHEIENQFRCKTDLFVRRGLNVDPGYLNGSQVIVASTKRFANRVYLRNGIYADITLFFDRYTFRPHALTLPDYRTRQAIGFFNRLRRSYLKQIHDDTRTNAQTGRWRAEYLCSRTYTSTAAPRPSPALDVFLHWATEKSFKINGARVLDLGCGAGRNGIALAQQGATVYGVDIVREALSQFRARAKELGLQDKVRLFPLNAFEQLPFTPAGLDIILDITVLCNLLQPEFLPAYFKRITSLLSPEGLFFLATFDEADEYYQYLRRDHSLGPLVVDPNNRIRSRFYSRDEILETMTSINRTVLRADSACNAVNEINKRPYNRCYRCFLWQRDTQPVTLGSPSPPVLASATPVGESSRPLPCPVTIILLRKNSHSAFEQLPPEESTKKCSVHYI